MQKPCLNDPDEYPNDEVLARYLGEVKTIWDLFITFLQESHPSLTAEWRYYKDGKSWLCKIVKKKKTICWTSVYQNMFKATFYFAERFEELIKNSELSQKYIDQFTDGKKYGKIKGITVEITGEPDLDAIKILISLKEKAK